MSDTVWDVKNLLQAKVGTSAKTLTLLFDLNKLKDEDSLEICGIKKWSTLYIGLFFQLIHSKSGVFFATEKCPETCFYPVISYPIILLIFRVISLFCNISTPRVSWLDWKKIT